VPPERQTGKGRTFVEGYRARYKAEPEGYAIYAYEAAKVAIDAIARAGKKDRAAVLAAVAATRDFDGALGTWSFDANGDTSLTVMSGNNVVKGAFAFVKTLEVKTPTAAPPSIGPAPATTVSESRPAGISWIVIVAGVAVLVGTLIGIAMSRGKDK
jgi:hypothetical protein